MTRLDTMSGFVLHRILNIRAWRRIHRFSFFAGLTILAFSLLSLLTPSDYLVSEERGAQEMGPSESKIVWGDRSPQVGQILKFGITGDLFDATLHFSYLSDDFYILELAKSRSRVDGFDVFVRGSNYFLELRNPKSTNQLIHWKVQIWKVDSSKQSNERIGALLGSFMSLSAFLGRIRRALVVLGLSLMGLVAFFVLVPTLLATPYPFVGVVDNSLEPFAMKGDAIFVNGRAPLSSVELGRVIFYADKAGYAKYGLVDEVEEDERGIRAVVRVAGGHQIVIWQDRYLGVAVDAPTILGGVIRFPNWDRLAYLYVVLISLPVPTFGWFLERRVRRLVQLRKQTKHRETVR